MRCVIANDITSVIASKQSVTKKEVLEIVMLDIWDELFVVYDSRFDLASCSPQLNVNITFYINVFFKLNNIYNGYCVEYENPVIIRLNSNYGATGYSNPKVSVTSCSSSRINFKGSSALTADSTFTMIGTNSLNVA